MLAQFTGNYEFLSNFYIEPDGTCVENEFQAAKTLDPELSAYILNSPKPYIAKQRGNEVSLRPDWEQVKIAVMLRFILGKYDDHSELAEKLMATYPAVLEEGNNHGDELWGKSLRTGKGLNWLGILTMIVRSELFLAWRD